MPKAKKAGKPRYDPPREVTTITSSISYSKLVFAWLECRRSEDGQAARGRPEPRSEYIEAALVDRWKREGHWPPPKNFEPEAWLPK
jgi:hypothetical protein